MRVKKCRDFVPVCDQLNPIHKNDVGGGTFWAMQASMFIGRLNPNISSMNIVSSERCELGDSSFRALGIHTERVQATAARPRWNSFAKGHNINGQDVYRISGSVDTVPLPLITL